MCVHLPICTHRFPKCCGFGQAIFSWPQSYFLLWSSVNCFLCKNRRPNAININIFRSNFNHFNYYESIHWCGLKHEIFAANLKLDANKKEYFQFNLFVIAYRWISLSNIHAKLFLLLCYNMFFYITFYNKSKERDTSTIKSTINVSGL